MKRLLLQLIIQYIRGDANMLGSDDVLEFVPRQHNSGENMNFFQNGFIHGT